jgi:hypothetical protein
MMIEIEEIDEIAVITDVATIVITLRREYRLERTRLSTTNWMRNASTGIVIATIVIESAKIRLQKLLRYHRAHGCRASPPALK